jgi:GT2 family glycosyltransferase
LAQSSQVGDGGATPEITIVIPTHDRYGKLVALLRSIRDNWTPSIDSVVVVDDSVHPQDLSEEFGDIGLRHIILRNRVFITKAKNLGWRASRTDYIYFIDDDNVIGPSTMPHPFRTMTKDPRAGAVMPAVLYKSEPDLVWVYATPLLRDRFKMNLVGRNLPRNPAFEDRLLRTDALPNASLVRRGALDEVGGFNEGLVINSSMDLALKLKSRGWKVLADTGAFIFHDVEAPGKVGWWATHGAVDHQRVQYEIRDWFLLRRELKPNEQFFTLKALLESSQFVIPNLFAYLVRGKSKRNLVRALMTGYIQGIVNSSREGPQK